MPSEKPSLDDLKIHPDDRERKSSGWVVPVLAVLALAIAVGAWFVLTPGADARPTVRVAAAQAPAGAADATVLNASGYVVARRLATVSSKVTGRVVGVFVEEGMRVSEGDELARLDDSTVRSRLALRQSELDAAQAALNETRVRLDEARRDEARKASLRADRLVSEAELDAAQSQVKALEARLESARRDVSVSERSVDVVRQELDDLIIRAPFSGVVISKDAQPGEMISPVSAGGSFTRTGICTIVDMDSREIEVDVNEAYINRVSAGQPVAARLDAYPDWEIPTRVINIVPAADRQKATVRVRIGFDELDDRILPDMGVKVQFLEEVEPAPVDGPAVLSVVPEGAVVRDGGTSVVWVVAGETVERRAVRAGDARGTGREIIAGVRPGERVVISDIGGLEDGTRVSVE